MEKKVVYLSEGRIKCFLEKNLLKMKLTILCLLLSFAQLLASKGFSQSQAKLTLNLENVRLEEVLLRIEEQSNLYFIYNREVVDVNRKVNVSYNDAEVKKVLAELFRETGVEYEIRGSHIILKGNSDQSGQKKVTGMVSDSNGQPLPGVTVIIKGTAFGTVTGKDGDFLLTNIREDAILVFSFVGMKSQEIPVAGKTSFNIKMLEETIGLEEVVAIGYGTMKKTDLVNSVTNIESDRLIKRPVSNVQQTLQGLAPGVTVLDLGGAPGRSEATIRVRGITTFNINKASSAYGGYELTKNAPLIIIDGIEQNLSQFNPDEIESVSVLKDASSTAIYGSRATNGVILISTKRAKEDKLEINYHGYFGIQQTINRPKMMGLEDYMRLQVAAYTNSGAALPAKFSEESIQTWVNATDREKYPLPNTFYDAVFSPAPQHNHSFSVAGGNNLIKTRISARFMDQDGIAPKYRQTIKELKLTSDLKASEKFSFSVDVNYRNNYSTTPMVEPFQNILHGSLWAYPKYSDGSYGLSSQGNNPLMFAEKSGISARTSDNLVANLRAEWQITDGLKLSTQYGYIVENIMAKNHTNSYTNTDKNTGITKTVANNNLTEVRNTLKENTWINLLTFEKQFGSHSLNALAGYSEILNKQTFLSAYRERFYNNDIQSINQGTNDGTKNNNGYDAEYALRSYFGRINYIFDNKYLFEANGRYDGSSKFIGGKRYSFFPSLSAGWRVSEENFWSGLENVVNNFKVRASWGKPGISRLDYIATILHWY